MNEMGEKLGLPPTNLTNKFITPSRLKWSFRARDGDAMHET